VVHLINLSKQVCETVLTLKRVSTLLCATLLHSLDLTTDRLSCFQKSIDILVLLWGRRKRGLCLDIQLFCGGCESAREFIFWTRVFRKWVESWRIKNSMPSLLNFLTLLVFMEPVWKILNRLIFFIEVSFFVVLKVILLLLTHSCSNVFDISIDWTNEHFVVRVSNYWEEVIFTYMAITVNVIQGKGCLLESKNMRQKI
jgi:hypothetical protein